MGEKVVHIKGEYITLAQLLKKLDYIFQWGRKPLLSAGKLGYRKRSAGG